MAPTAAEVELGGEIGFEQAASDVLGRLQTAIRSLIEATPGLTGRPAELAQTLGIHTKLAWQAHRVAHAADPLAEAGNIPKPGAMSKFLDAAATRGAPQVCVDAVLAAQEDLESLIKRHAGSRGEFDTMASSLTERGSDQMDLIQKRAIFKGQSHILGVQAKTHLGCFILSPSDSHADRIDWICIRGLIGLRRLRRDASWIISQTRFARVDSAGRQPVTGEPIDPDVDEAHGVSLLTEFCSRPLPRIRRVPMDLPNMTNIEIVGDGLGNASSVTCLVGELFRESTVRYRDEYNQRHVSNIRVRTPCETLIHDVLVHESLEGFDEPNLSVYSDHRDVDIVLESQLEARECDKLPLRESVVYLGKGPDVMEVADVPRYGEMMNHALKRVGWDPKQFRVFRARVEYPVMPSSVVIHFDLPDKPR